KNSLKKSIFDVSKYKTYESGSNFILSVSTVEAGNFSVIGSDLKISCRKSKDLAKFTLGEIKGNLLPIASVDLMCPSS
ncbi:MAG: hypothetical protein ACHQVK_02355, partial [Candidatus Paceibacterales bacterium]